MYSLREERVGTYRSVNHDGRQERLLAGRNLADRFSSTVHRLGVVIRTLCTTSENHMHVGIT